MKAIKTSFLLLGISLVLLTQSSCAYYQRYSMPKARLKKINPAGLSIYLVDAAHPLTRGWYLTEPKFEGDKVTGFISRMAEVETLEASLVRNRFDAQQSKNDILLFAKPQFAATLPDTATMTIQNDQLEKIEVCEMNQLKTVGRPLVGCTSLLFLAYLFTSGE